MQQFDLFNDNSPQPKRRPKPPQEFKVVALRDCPLPDRLRCCDRPDQAVEYWRTHVVTAPWFSPQQECFVVLLLNTRLRVMGHQVVSIGLLDTVLVHAREVFRAAIIACAHSIALMHNHPSGDPTPSDADLRVTRDLIRAGELLKLPVTDHVIIGNPKHSSLRELGCFSRC